MLKYPIADFLSLAKHLAREAGHFALRASKQELRIEEKSNEFDLVTHVDKHNEEYIRNEVAKIYPQHSFLGEEDGASGGGEVKWIVDPIDGTINFAHGVPIWCVSIGIEIEGELACGAIYDPNRDEMFTCQIGGGAFLNDSLITVSAVTDPTKSLLVTGFPYNINTNPNKSIERFNAFLERGILVRRLGSAALDLCYVACGRFDGFFEGALSPWDTAAGALLVREAGGRVTGYDGNAHSIYDKPIIASNGKLHNFINEVVQSV